MNVILDLDGSPKEWQALGDGFAVGVEITTWSAPDVIQIPTSALFRQGTDWDAFLAADGRARAHTITMGHRGPLKTEIVGGLQPDETVIIHPGAGVHDGVRVTYR